jgi:hypothetical protein
MRRSRVESRSSRGAPLVRLGSMIVLLFLVFALIQQARDPHMWAWLTNEPAPPERDGSPGHAAAEGKQGIDPVVPKDSSGGKPQPPGAPNEKSPEDKAPEDKAHEEQERARAKELLDLVTDRTLTPHRREMPAYRRLVKQVEDTPIETLRKGAGRRPFNDLYLSPRAHRGELLKIELNVRRVLPIEIEGENPLGFPRMYELWGWTNESKAWPYIVVTPDLPPGTPQGADVEFRATVVGYFFKLQGYHEAGAKPNARPLAAPVLIARLDWQPPPPRQAADDATWFWIAIGVSVVAAAVLIFWLIVPAMRGRRKSTSKTASDAPPELPEWLRQAPPSPADTEEGGGSPTGPVVP